jgi:hypothetical protein
MKRVPMAVAVAAPVLLTVVSGFLHGHMTNRWGPSHDMLAAAHRLEAIPSQFGDWQLRDTEEIGADTLKTLQCAGYFVRAYVNRVSGETVKVAILLGPPGPIAVHVPEVCFPSQNYAILEGRAPLTINDGSAEPSAFWATTFQANTLEGSHLRVCYAWGVDGTWHACENPRVEFASQGYLYKIQLAGELPPNQDGNTRDVCARFLDDFVPAARSCLVGADR